MADEYISASHPEIGRTGPICPFVAPSRKNRTMEIACGWRPRADPRADRGDRPQQLREYELTTWQGRNPMLRAMVVALPDLRSEDTGLLDQAHAR
ncbi:hypothetical protein E4K10_46145 [Streptomyces sp. T1317-0309]|nr:hypothetical protein E4K10_46145 [Streptomyces sp. T1317-0309]